jgi:hypothetical protein
MKERKNLRNILPKRNETKRHFQQYKTQAMKKITTMKMMMKKKRAK